MTASQPAPFTFPPFAAMLHRLPLPEVEPTPPGNGRGRFIIFDGPDGGGKTDQVAMTSRLLTKIGIAHKLTKQPGGSKLGAKIREILFKDVGTANIDADALELLFMANHVQNCAEVEGNLRAGFWVIADRWSPSAIAYMAARGADGPVQKWYRTLLDRVKWDVFFLLTGDAEKLLLRAQARTTESHQTAKKWNNVEQASVVVDAFRREFAYLPTTSVIYTDMVKREVVFEYVAEQLRQRLNVTDIDTNLIDEVIHESRF